MNFLKKIGIVAITGILICGALNIKNSINSSHSKEASSTNTESKSPAPKPKDVNKDESSISVDSKNNSNLNGDKNQNESINSFDKNKNDNFIFIGDSRTVGMSNVVDISDYEFITFIAKSSQGYDWLKDTAIDKLVDRLNTTNLKYNIVFNLGVNDLYNVDKYVNLYNEIAKSNPNHNFFAVSVNPEDEAKMISAGYKDVGNVNIENFNNTLKESLSDKVHYIDSYSHFINDNNFETVSDGLHYTNQTSKAILDYISSYIKEL